MKPYENYLDTLRRSSKERSETRFAANQLLELHYEASKRENPIIVELGVDKGQSTKVFLNAIDEKPNAKLISVDILDCKNAAKSDKWEFVQQDSADIEALILKKPFLKDGIDLLYVDSKHTDEHVMKEVYSFFRYIKENGVIYFDDIDSGPYMRNQRKDSVSLEIANRKILNLLESIFRSNHSSIDFIISRGSTGLAKYIKKSKLGDELKPPLFINERRFSLFWRFLKLITFKKSYQHNNKTKDSFLIDPGSSNSD